MSAAAHKQLRHVLGVTSGATPESGKPEYWDGDIRWVTPEDVSALDGYWLSDTRRRITREGYNSCGTSMAPRGAIVLTKRAPIGQLAILTEPACSNQGCFLLTPRGEQDSRYYFYWLATQTYWLQALGRGSTFMELSTDELKALQVPEPLPQRQRAIADFLDRETARIDALIEAKERALELLAEKRRAVITHVVTRGLDPNVKLRDSGIPWLGTIPTHWDVVPLMHLTDVNRPIMYGIVLPGPDVGEGVPILKGGNVRPERLNLASLARTTREIEAPFARARLRERDLVYSIRGSIGDCELVPAELEGSNITQDVARIAPSGDVNPSWLRFALLSEPVRQALAAGSLGAAVRGINIFDLKRARIPTPPPDEQELMTAYLSRRLNRLDLLASRTQETINLSKEHRSALIAAAVSGQIEVEATQ